VEAVGDPDELAAAAGEAQAAGVLLAVLLLGRSAGGRSVAQSHTGAIVGESELVAAWLGEQGAVVVDSAEELGRVAALWLRLGPACRDGAAFIATVSGGSAGHSGDLAARHGVPLAWLASETEATLRALLPDGAYVGNPLDVQTGESVAVYSAQNAFAVGAIIRVAHSFLVSEIVLIGDAPWYEKASMGMQHFEEVVILRDENAFFEHTRGRPLWPWTVSWPESVPPTARDAHPHGGLECGHSVNARAPASSDDVPAGRAGVEPRPVRAHPHPMGGGAACPSPHAGAEAGCGILCR